MVTRQIQPVGRGSWLPPSPVADHLEPPLVVQAGFVKVRLPTEGGGARFGIKALSRFSKNCRGISRLWEGQSGNHVVRCGAIGIWTRRWG